MTSSTQGDASRAAAPARDATPPATITVYISIGNSDDKLTQGQWANYVANFQVTVRRHAAHVHGDWLSASDSPFQNACMCVEIDHNPDKVEHLKMLLAELAVAYGQDSIAWAEAETQFIRGATSP